MILNHLWGLYSHPRQEWRSINSGRENLIYGISHILIISLFPAICCYFSAVYLGWYVTLDQLTTLPAYTAAVVSVVLYLAMVSGVFL